MHGAYFSRNYRNSLLLSFLYFKSLTRDSTMIVEENGVTRAYFLKPFVRN